jgi:threonine dehydratase
MEFNKLTQVPSLSDIKQVAKELLGIVQQSPLEFSKPLSDRLGARIYVKREDLQRVRSYKIRGAYYKLSNLPAEARAKGIVAASAGNHAQGVAFACAQLGIQGYIFMPESTPLQKVEAVRFFGKDFIRIKLVGQTYDATFAAAQKFCAQQGSIFIPPFDDFDIIAGQATVGLEIAEQITEPLDYIFLAIGGGGLAAGTCLSLSALSPETQIIGVEPEAAASMTASLAEGRVVELDTIDKFVDGASVKRVGDKTFPICAKGLSDVVLISKSAVCQAMLDLYAMDAMIVEPAGALSIAALPKYAEKIKGKSVICIISGGNFDPKRFPEIKEAAVNPH